MRTTTPIDRFEDAFAEAVRERGTRYLRHGRVKLTIDAKARSAGRRVICATVDGAREYEVRVERDGKTLRIRCSCPFFAYRREFCKHVWATLLAVQDDMPWELARASELAYLAPGKEQRPPAAGVEPAAGVRVRHPPGQDVREQTAASHQNVPWPSWKPLVSRTYRLGVEDSRTEARADSRRPVSELWYVLHVERVGTRWVPFVLTIERRSSTGNDVLPAFRAVPPAELRARPLANQLDRAIVALLEATARASHPTARSGQRLVRPAPGWWIPPERTADVLRALAETGRLARCVRMSADGSSRLMPVAWQDDGPPELRLRLQRDGAADRWQVLGDLCGFVSGRSWRWTVTPEDVLIAGDVLMCGGLALPATDCPGLVMWVKALASPEGVHVSADDLDDFIGTMLDVPNGPALELPSGTPWREERVPVTPQVRLRVPVADTPKTRSVEAEVFFAYDELSVHPREPRKQLVDLDDRRVVPRDLDEESARLQRLRESGFHPYDPSHPSSERAHGLVGRFYVDDLISTVRMLLREGWFVLGQDGPVFRAGQLQVRVSSGIDWFDLHGDVGFAGGRSAGFEVVLDAIRSGRRWVALDDSGFGLLPEAWFRACRPLAEMADDSVDGTRLSRAQLPLVDATLESIREADPTAVEVEVDAGFERARRRLMRVDGIDPEPAPHGFRGELRSYQQLALGWARFLEEAGFGGCLADDMGLGKTIEVLAILLSRKERLLQPDSTETTATFAPSLVVVPRSLVFNWLNELARFAPGLRVVDHSRSSRDFGAGAFADCDVVLTTYGVLRRDIEWLAEVSFDYCILDESQAIKNPYCKTAQASRRLRARHRLALSGTPIENHLLELWSQFEFLNSGMLGSEQTFRRRMRRDQDLDAHQELLARMVRPFILRRTKREVAPELPRREEHQILCRLGPRQRKLYERLLETVRSELLSRVDREGVEGSSVQILEALLRLRQSACHAALVDPTLRRVPSAKLEMLFAKLSEVRTNGHKALVFSQFVKLLALVRDRLDRMRVPYAYLDGQTRRRQEQVERFQGDPCCPLFLISLKAGGLGLNLTAAEYVFLLDPWWNPAVEAQAVDRAHRIGQQHPVFAYRLVAEDTIEQKILDLQRQKKELADAVIRSDRGFLSQLSVDDLRVLLT